MQEAGVLARHPQLVEAVPVGKQSRDRDGGEHAQELDGGEQLIAHLLEIVLGIADGEFRRKDTGQGAKQRKDGRRDGLRHRQQPHRPAAHIQVGDDQVQSGGKDGAQTGEAVPNTRGQEHPDDLHVEVLLVDRDFRQQLPRIMHVPDKQVEGSDRHGQAHIPNRRHEEAESHHQDQDPHKVRDDVLDRGEVELVADKGRHRIRRRNDTNQKVQEDEGPQQLHIRQDLG